MLNRFRSVVSNVIGGISGLPGSGDSLPEPEEEVRRRQRSRSLPSPSEEGPTTVKYAYNRPVFLQLNSDEIQVAADTVTRPILVPRDISRLPWNAGYAEVINAGKTKLSEDQAWAGVLSVPRHPSAVSELRPEECAGRDSPSTTTGSLSSTPTHGSPCSDFEILTDDPLPFTYFGLFDGHAGTGAAIMAVRLLHRHIQVQLSIVRELIIAKRYNLDLPTSPHHRPNMDAERSFSSRCILPDKTNSISLDDIIIGALETAFQSMDAEIREGHTESDPAESRTVKSWLCGSQKWDAEIREGHTESDPAESRTVKSWLCGSQKWDDQIAHERTIYRIAGGCTAVAAIFFLGKLYVANAGDSRAILCLQDQIVPMSYDFTPESEKQRVQYLGYLQPELLQNEFTHLEFPRRVSRKDVGKKMLYRDALMKGWGYKTITEQDLKFPLVYGEGKRARVLATIGVTRGFGDHDLKVQSSNIHIKPFLLAIPQVKIYDVCDYEHTEDDVLIMGSDGLWDVTSNDKAAQIVRNCLKQFEPDDRTRYTSAAQELVMYARGLLKKGWRTTDDTPASGDDISAFVIPICKYANSFSESSSTESSLDAGSTS